MILNHEFFKSMKTEYISTYACPLSFLSLVFYDFWYARLSLLCLATHKGLIYFVVDYKWFGFLDFF